MEEKYTPRTVAIVALVALVVGFLLVFGGGMLLLRPRARDSSALDVPPPSPRPRARPRDGGAANAAGGATSDTSNTAAAGSASANSNSGTAPVDDPSGEPSSGSNAGSGADGGANANAAAGDGGAGAGPAREPTSVAGITIGPASTSRCFNQGSVEPIAAAQCDQLPDLDRFIVSKATDIAACVRGGAHGRLMMVLDFRVSTSFMRGWGSPTSNIPNAGTVAACVKTALTPLPFSSMQHQHDRYLVTVPIDW